MITLILNVIFFLSPVIFFLSLIRVLKEKNSLTKSKKACEKEENLNVTAQLKYELKWKYFLLLKTQTESPSK